MIHSSTLYLISKIALCTFPLSVCACLVVHSFPKVGNFDLEKVPVGLFAFLNRIAWGAKYIVKINETWVLARGWEMKNGNISVVFEPYKQAVIGFKAGSIYEIADPSCWYKVPICWDDKNIYDNVVARNIMSLKEKHPVDDNFERDRQPAPYPFQHMSRIAWRNMSEDDMSHYIRRHVLRGEGEDYDE